jgi:hypothetical protein
LTTLGRSVLFGGIGSRNDRLKWLALSIKVVQRNIFTVSEHTDTVGNMNRQIFIVSFDGNCYGASLVRDKKFFGWTTLLVHSSAIPFVSSSIGIILNSLQSTKFIYNTISFVHSLFRFTYFEYYSPQTTIRIGTYTSIFSPYQHRVHQINSMVEK